MWGQDSNTEFAYMWEIKGGPFNGLPGKQIWASIKGSWPEITFQELMKVQEVDGMGEDGVGVRWQALEQSPEVYQEIKESTKGARRQFPEEKQEKQHEGNNKGEDFQRGRRDQKCEMIQTNHKNTSTVVH